MDTNIKRTMARREFLAGITGATSLYFASPGMLVSQQVASKQTAQTADGIKHRTIETNGIRMQIAEQGTGPLVVFCHGFPESWYSWRHQLPAMADAGFHAVAPDMRGYGQTDRPTQIDQYSILHLVADIVGLLDALTEPTAVIVGHDWGSVVAWHAALLRPDRFRAIVGLSVPFRPRGTVPPTTVMPQTEDMQFYQLYLQKPGVAEADMERDIRETVLRIFYGSSGDGMGTEPVSPPDSRSPLMVPKSGGYISRKPKPASLPEWLTERDLDFYTAEFTRTGFGGGLNWYRNIDRNWELLAAFAGAVVTIPALYMVGDRDGTLLFQGMPELVSNLSKYVPKLRQTVRLPGCGHWTQQERPKEVNTAIVEFLKHI